ncbi:MAG: type II toxin-antitoxin system RelE/ParE family toxin, partial [Chromatiaceae bacterium]|nr:type II toxin-antitoxin system RelE/ParE family toxin [Chromatiaceae bacterium]
MTVARDSFAESALGDLAGIQAWYAAEGVPEVGDRLVAEVFQRVEVFADHPDLGRIVPEFGQRCRSWRAKRGPVVPGRRRRGRLAGVAAGRSPGAAAARCPRIRHAV